MGPLESPQPLLESVGQHAGALFVQQNHTAAVRVWVQFDLTVTLGDDQICEPACNPVLRTGRVNHAAAIAVGGVVLGHLTTIAPQWNRWHPLSVAFRARP
jgi:hypothetical protein